jgi:hypothetical protein
MGQVILIKNVKRMIIYITRLAVCMPVLLINTTIMMLLFVRKNLLSLGEQNLFTALDR